MATVLAGQLVLWALASATAGVESTNACDARPRLPRATPATASTAATRHSTLRTGIPYALDRKVIPEGLQVEQVLPEAIGPFARHELDEAEHLPADADLNVEYRSGSRFVVIGFVATTSEEVARCAVLAARGAAPASGPRAKGGPPTDSQQELLDGEFTFVKTGDFIAWNTGRHFFYVKANRPDVLDQFMQHFAR